MNESSSFAMRPPTSLELIVQLTASGNFEEALTLCKLLPPKDASLRAMVPQLSETEEHAALEFKKMSHNTLMALIKFL
ncbi:hypothetical protein PTKIN_Ptkin08bG0108200 [Pterospermum kingtungense]